jgi:Na+/proline symporter
MINRDLIKERDYMKKSVISKVISIVFALITILAIACAITGSGSGFLDLSNIARAVCIGVAVICGILAFVTWKAKRK